VKRKRALLQVAGIAAAAWFAMAAAPARAQMDPSVGNGAGPMGETLRMDPSIRRIYVPLGRAHGSSMSRLRVAPEAASASS
jgi:hypothetical protein